MGNNTHFSAVIILVIVVILAAVIFAVLPIGIRPNADDQKCRLRLLRMGQAVNLWVNDHGRRIFPAINNPEPGTEWQPGLTGDAGSVLWEFLHGDMPKPQHETESDAEYLERVRDGLWTVCPVNRLPYWYNQDLRAIKPLQLASGELDSLVYFRCQRSPDGTWPHQADDKHGVHAVRGIGVQYQITPEEIAQLQKDIAELEEREPRHLHLPQMRKQLNQLQEAARGDGFAVSVRLDTEVVFEQR